MRTRTRVLVPVLLATLGGSAFAQPATGEPDPLAQPPPDPMQPEQPPQPPQPLQQQQPQPPPPPPTGEASTGRPPGTSIGIGLGYVITMGSNIQQPNVATARVRFRSGFTIEPEVLLGASQEIRDDGNNDETDAENQLTFGALARIPLARRGKFDLELLGGARLSVLKEDPDGDDNATTTTRITLGWGVAVSYWITEHWNLTLGATNPLVSFSRVETENPSPLSDSSVQTTGVFAAFDPAVIAMLHLYF